MMPILVKSDDVRSGRKAKVHHSQLQAAQESMGQGGKFNSKTSLLRTFANTKHSFVPVNDYNNYNFITFL